MQQPRVPVEHSDQMPATHQSPMRRTVPLPAGGKRAASSGEIEFALRQAASITPLESVTPVRFLGIRSDAASQTESAVIWHCSA